MYTTYSIIDVIVYSILFYKAPEGSDCVQASGAASLGVGSHRICVDFTNIKASTRYGKYCSGTKQRQIKTGKPWLGNPEFDQAEE